MVMIRMYDLLPVFIMFGIVQVTIKSWALNFFLVYRMH